MFERFKKNPASFTQTYFLNTLFLILKKKIFLASVVGLKPADPYDLRGTINEGFY